MQQLGQIKAAYDWFFNYWQQEATKAAQANDTALLNQLEEKRDSLERGIFVLMFGQFEVAVNNTFATARASRLASTDWTKRRGWDMPSLQHKTHRIPFETRLSLVMDKTSPFYQAVIDTYSLRNHCAHGGTTRQVGSIDALETNLYNWQSALRS